MVGFGVAFLIALSWSLLAPSIGARLGIVDEPDDPSLKVHRTAAVPLGGVGVFAAVVAGTWIVGGLDPGTTLAAGVLLVAGLLDDIKGLPPWLRLGVEVAAGVLLAALAAIPESFTSPLGAVAVVAVVVLAVNAVNLLDGIDGLAAASGAISALGIAALALSRGLSGSFGIILGAALLGFLAVNWPPARVFLGDNGAYVVGLYLAFGILRVSPAAGWQLLLSLGVLGVFALDLVITVLRRLLGRAPLFSGDRAHLYDQAVGRGFSVSGVVLIAAWLQIGFVLTVVVLDQSHSRFLQAGTLLAIGTGLIVALALGGFLRPTGR